MKEPLVTVLMSVYNAEAYLSEAVESVLAQTYQNFEFLIVDDASTDQSAVIIDGYPDHRIRLIRNQTNLGLTTSLNKGLAQARGKYIARTDADDVSYSVRLERQVAFMEAHPVVGLCGTWGRLLGLAGNHNRTFPTQNNDLQVALLCYNPFIHPSVMLRTGALQELDTPFDERFRYAQDYELWSRLSEQWEIANLPDVLIGYRIHDQQISSHRPEAQDQCLARVVQSQLNKLGIEADAEQVRFIRHVLSQCFPYHDEAAVQQAHAVLLQLEAANQHARRYDSGAFRRYLDESWARLVADLPRLTKDVKQLVKASPFRMHRSLSKRERVRLYIKLAFV